MRFVWDDRKRAGNLRKHGIDFAGVELLFEGFAVTVPDDRLYYGESRFITLGILEQLVVVVAHTETVDEIRIISIRKATRHEEKEYFRQAGFQDFTH
ncbi:MAG TPA: BrnT family toxin [Candidatus Acidoferrum sp.]|nr:BrnT family toxin [Candidatus Acidoferrum sp.]